MPRLRKKTTVNYLLQVVETIKKNEVNPLMKEKVKVLRRLIRNAKRCNAPIHKVRLVEELNDATEVAQQIRKEAGVDCFSCDNFGWHLQRVAEDNKFVGVVDNIFEEDRVPFLDRNGIEDREGEKKSKKTKRREEDEKFKVATFKNPFV